MLSRTMLRSLAAVVGSSHVLTGDAAAGFAVDWTGRFQGRTPAVVRPRDSAEVAAVLALCTEAGIPVVPQGGNTGLAGGGVPLHGEVVLSLTRLNQLGLVDLEAAQVTAGAGVTLQRVADGRHENAVFSLVASLGGSISAEHGIGTLKAPWLPLVRSDSERALFARIRSAFDPSGTLNPNILPR